LTFLAVQGDVETFGHEPFPQVLDALPRTKKRVGDLLVFPIRSVDIGFEQNVGSPDFRGRSLQFFDDGEARLTLFVAQSNNVNLLHDETSVC
jgi:hypothetical protein